MELIKSQALLNYEYLIQLSEETRTSHNPLPGEYWKVCPIADNYEVSNYGRLRALGKKNVIMKFAHGGTERSMATYKITPPDEKQMNARIDMLMRLMFRELLFDIDDMFSYKGEEWIPLKEEYSRYLCSSLGRIKSVTPTGEYHYLIPADFAKERSLIPIRYKITSTITRKEEYFHTGQFVRDNFLDKLRGYYLEHMRIRQQADNERWVAIPNFRDEYWVSNYGRIYSIKNSDKSPGFMPQEIGYNVKTGEYSKRIEIYQNGHKGSRSRRIMTKEFFQDPNAGLSMEDFVNRIAEGNTIHGMPEKSEKTVSYEQRVKAKHNEYALYDSIANTTEYFNSLQEIDNKYSIPLSMLEEMLDGRRGEVMGKRVYYNKTKPRSV